MLKELSVRIGADTSEFVRSMTQVSNKLSDTTQDIREFGTDTDSVMSKVENAIGNRLGATVSQFASNAGNRFESLRISAQNTFNRMTNHIEQEFNKIKNEFSQMAKQAEASTESLQTIGGNMQAFVTLPVLAAGAASVKLASDMQESLNKVNVAFGDSARSVLSWSESSIEQMGLASGSALDAAALFGDMGTSMGITQDKAATMAMSLTQLGADLASFKNISIEQAMQALNGVFTGETESLKMLGVVMTQTQLEAFALSNGIQKNIQDMTEAEMVNLRYAFVMDRTKNAQGDFARTSEGAANQMRMFTQLMKEIGVQLGNVILPVFNDIVQAVNDKLKAFAELSDATKKLIVLSGLLVAALGPILLFMGSIVPAIMTSISAFRALSVAMTITAGSATAAGLAISTTMAVITSPIGIAVASIAALSAGAIILAKNWENVSTRIKLAIAVLIPGFGSLVVAGGYIIKNWEEVKATIWAVTQIIKKSVTETFVSMANFVQEKVDKVTNLVNNLKRIFSNVFPQITKTVTDSFGMIRLWIDGMAKSITDFVGNTLKSLGIAWEESALAVEIAEYKKQYALQKSIDKANENAGATDYMTSRLLIETGRMAESTVALNINSDAADKNAKKKSDAAKKTKDLVDEQQKMIDSSVKLADTLGNAVVDALKKQLDKQEQTQRESLESLKTQSKNYYQKIIDDSKSAYDKDVQNYKNSADQKISALTKVYNEQAAALDASTKSQLMDIDNQIEAIQIATEQEERQLKAAEFERAKNEKISALKSAKTEEERGELLNDLREMDVKRERELLLQSRNDLVEDLRQRQEWIRADAERRRKQREEEYKQQVEKEKQNLSEGLTALESNFNLREGIYSKFLNATDSFYSQELKKLADFFANRKKDEEIEQTAREELLKGNQTKLIGLLETYNPKWLEAGKSFGQKLLDGILQYSPDVTSAVETMLNKIKPLTLIPTKANSKTTNSGGFKINNAAEGGIFTSPTIAMIGDGGRSEAVLPLSRLAEMTNAQPTHIYLDGREITRGIAPIMVDTIRQKIGAF